MKITQPSCLVLLSMSLAQASLILAAEAVPVQPPNIVYILADDLGYGDVQCLNPQYGKIKSPNLDRLASQGMTFTNAHSGSAVCTPSRYGILTGKYAWRKRLQSGVIGGFSPPLIEPGRLTVPAQLKQHGYQKTCMGKWHLGIDWPKNDSPKFDDKILDDHKDSKAMNSVDWTKPILEGPTTHGFDYFYGISASLDMPSFVFIENIWVTAVPTTVKKWLRTGPAIVDFEAVDVLPKLKAKTVAQIKAHAAAHTSISKPRMERLADGAILRSE